MAVIDVPGQRVLLGHRAGGAFVVDASVAMALSANVTYTLMVTLKGASASITVNGTFGVSTGYNAGVSDGRVGVVTESGSATFGSFRVRTDDSQFVPAPVATPVVSVSSVAVLEGSSALTVQVPVTLSAPSESTVTVTVRLSGGTATAGTDYTAWTVDQVVTFAPGTTTATVSVVVRGDTVREADETVTLTLLSATGATLGTAVGTLTIKNDD